MTTLVLLFKNIESMALPIQTQNQELLSMKVMLMIFFSYSILQLSISNIQTFLRKRSTELLIQSLIIALVFQSIIFWQEAVI